MLPYDKPKDIPRGKRYEEVYKEFPTERPPTDNINTDLPYFLVKVPTLINRQNLEEIPFETHPDAINKGTYIFRIIFNLNYAFTKLSSLFIPPSVFLTFFLNRPCR